MSVYQYIRYQKIPSDIKTVWDFISSPENLKRITPPHMGFDIRFKDIPKEMYEGLMIAYQVKPLLGIKTLWLTEITHVEKEKYFVDEQRIGPYLIWHHEHFIEAIDGGVLMKDIITYEPPFGIIGQWANRLLIRRKLEEIFAYRNKALSEIFGVME